MVRFAALSRSVLVALSLLSACAAGGTANGVATPTSDLGTAYGAFLGARFAGSQFDIQSAAQFYRVAAAADPTDPMLRQHAFITSLMAGDPETGDLVRGTAADDEVATLFRIGEAARANAWNRAIAEIRTLPTQGVTRILSPLLLAWAEQGEGKIDQALATLEPHVSGPRARGVDTLHAALIADLAGRDRVAAREYARVARTFSVPNLALTRALASWQARQGKIEKARQTLALLAVHDPNLAMILPDLERHMAERRVTNAREGMAEAYLALAASLQQQNATDLSIIMLRLALQVNGALTPARLMLADILSAGGQPAAALGALAPVTPSDPLVGLVDLQRAGLLEETGATSQAIALLDRLAQRYPTSPEPLAMKGDLLRAHARWDAAIGAYSAAISRISHPSKSDWAVFYDRGIAYDQAHDWPRAEADFQTALELDPEQPFVLNYLGYSWAVRGKHLAEAQRMITQAVKLRPDDGAILDSLGYVMLRQGDTAGALHWLLKAVTRQPDDPTINAHLGDAYWASGDGLAARYQWRLALSMHPDPEEAAALHAKLAKDGPTLDESSAAHVPGARTRAEPIEP